jgi:hypothetical protein
VLVEAKAATAAEFVVVEAAGMISGARSVAVAVALVGVEAEAASVVAAKAEAAVGTPAGVAVEAAVLEAASGVVCRLEA